MLHTFQTSMRLAVEIDKVFPFFAEAGNLAAITPPELCFRILTPRPITMREGTLIDYRLRLFGLPFFWRARISVWEPPARFIDEQIEGPYRQWVHTHTFTKHNGGTEITDVVRYRLPLWPAGELGAPVIRILLHRIFRYRRQAIRKAFGYNCGEQ